MHITNWDDIRYVLAVADSGSVSAAAKALGVNHATVIRRVAAFEEASGGPVFERGPQGYRLRPDRANVIDAAREASLAMRMVEQRMRGGDPAPGTVVRVTSVDSLCHTVLSDGFARIAAAVAPHRVALVASNLHLDMARLQADLTVRPADALPAGMRGERAGNLGFAVYAATDAADAWLGPCGALSNARPARWFDAQVAPERIAGRADSFLMLAQLAARGVGRSILPCILGDAHPGLHRVEAGFPDLSVPLWVAHHADLSGQSRIATLSDALLAVLRARAAALRG